MLSSPTLRGSFWAASLLVITWATAANAAEDVERYLLQAKVPADAGSKVSITLEMGGEMLVPGEVEQDKLRTNVRAQLEYQEQIVAWSPDSSGVARSLRHYERAQAQFRVEDQSNERVLPQDREWVLCELRHGESVVAGVGCSFTREQSDLLNVIANSLAIDRLLPGKEVALRESWNHDPNTLKSLLSMDHVAVCRVMSTLLEKVNNTAKMHMSGFVEGTIDGAPTEMELRGVYLFDFDRQRITQFNFAVKEVRKRTELVPGLDIVAKAFVTVDHHAKPPSAPQPVARASRDIAKPLTRMLVYELRDNGFRFQYDRAWYITAEQRDSFSFRYLHDHALAAHCNVAVLPPRSAGRHTTLEEFERDVRDGLTEHLQTVIASTQWETPRGYRCLGVIANGEVDDVPIQWRNYLVAADDCPRLSLAVTLEQKESEKFADAERQIIDSLEFMPVSTASRSAARE